MVLIWHDSLDQRQCVSLDSSYGIHVMWHSTASDCCCCCYCRCPCALAACLSSWSLWQTGSSLAGSSPETLLCEALEGQAGPETRAGWGGDRGCWGSSLACLSTLAHSGVLLWAQTTMDSTETNCSTDLFLPPDHCMMSWELEQQHSGVHIISRTQQAP